MRILVLLALAGCNNGLTGLTQADDDTSDVGVDSDTCLLYTSDAADE